MGDMPRASANNPMPTMFLLSIAYLGFVSLGLPDPIAGVAWPSVRTLFSLPQSGFGLVFIALGCGYCASGFFGGVLTLSLGLGNLLWISSGLVALAMFGFSLAPTWPLFVACAVIWGLGSGGIDTGLNAYSSRHFSARHVNWLHACYSVGATLGPLLMTIMLYWSSWRVGYAMVGGLLFAMMTIFLVTREQWNDPVQSPVDDPIAQMTLWGTLREPLVWLQMFLFFLYVGLEFTLGQWSFTILTESRHVPVDIAGPLASSYYGTIGIGRIIAGMIAARVGIDLLVRSATITAVVGTILFAVGDSVVVSNLGLVIAGLGLAPMFPCLMARTPARLGTQFAIHAVGFQASCGMMGAALLPGLAGILSDTISLESVTFFAILLAILLLVTHEVILLGYVKIKKSPA